MKSQFMLTQIVAVATVATIMTMAIAVALETMNRSGGSQVQITVTIKYLVLM